MKVFWIMLAGLWAVETAWAFPPGYNPFPEDARPEQVQFHVFHAGKMIQLDQEEGRTAVFQDTVDGHEIHLRLKEDDSHNVTMVLHIDGERRISDLPLGYSWMHLVGLLSGDLNQDGIADYVIQSWGGGSGRGASRTLISFVLSNGDGFKATAISAMHARPNPPDNFVMLGGRPCFIHTSDDGLQECQDGFSRNFFIHSILVFDQDQVRVDNALYSGFPMIQWDQDEHYNAPEALEWQESVGSETTLLTGAQKEELIREAIEGIFQ